MSILKSIGSAAAKDIGFGRPYNGNDFNWPIEDTTNPGPVVFDPSQPNSVFNSMFSMSGNTTPRFCYKGHTSATKAYIKCPPLSTIINRKAQAHINGKIWIMGADGKESQNTSAKKLRKLLAKPNPLQSWKQFDAQMKIYMQIFGFSIVLPIIPAGWEKFGPVEATSLWNIPPYMVEAYESNKLFYQTDLAGMLRSIKLSYKGEVTDLPLDKIGIFKDFTPSFNTLIFPESRIALQEEPINIIMAGMESETEVISYAGSQGLITPDSGSGGMVSIPLSPEQKLQLQGDFKRQYGIRKGQFRYIISPAAIKWQAMGTDPKKLNLIEYVEEASKSLCDGYGFPPALMGLLDPTFNNQGVAWKSFYQDTIIPESESMDEEWNNFFDTGSLDISIQRDYSHLPVLQEDRESMGRALMYLNQASLIQWQNNQITANEWRILTNMDTISDPLWDQYYSDWLAAGKIFGQPAAAAPVPPNPDTAAPKP